MLYKIFEDYKVYEDGTIVSPKGRTIKPSVTEKGYLVVRIKICGKWQTWFHHKVVMYAWVGERLKNQEIDHKDGVRYNNHISNLRYVTKEQNVKHSYDSGRRVVSGFNNANCKVTEEQVRELCKLFEKVEEVPNFSQLERQYGISRQTISKIYRHRLFTDVSKEYSFNSRFRD